MRILFITKRNTTYGFQSYCRRSSGLFNSTRFIVEGLLKRGVHAHIIEVIDNNCIDREVRKFKPDIVVIEALWVVPEKFPILQALHPRVKWFVHMHSGLPFLALEGIAMDWLTRYPLFGVGLIANSPETQEAYECIVPEGSSTYLPNVYIPKFRSCVPRDYFKRRIDVGCFGAIRPMKNHLTQAIAAIEFANAHGKPMRFHVNGSRVETGGDPCLKNLVQLFENQSQHRLILQPWMEHADFIAFLHWNIDIGLQVSLTETFNVVTADYVTSGIPCVVSKEVRWASRWNRAEDDSPQDIVRIMNRVWNHRSLSRWNQKLLEWNSAEAQELWFEWVHSLRRHK